VLGFAYSTAERVTEAYRGPLEAARLKKEATQRVGCVAASWKLRKRLWPLIFCGAFKGLKIRCREVIRLSDMQSGGSGGGEKSVSMSQASALRRLVYAKRLNFGTSEREKRTKR
jgi:hypothetical protein